MSIPSVQKISVGVIGAGGFTGQEIIRFLSRHEFVRLDFLTSTHYTNQKVSEALPRFENLSSHLTFKSHPKEISDFRGLDVCFISAPDEVSLQWAESLLKNNIRVIDIGGSFRFDKVHQFEENYPLIHSSPHLLGETTYGLSEVYRSQISSSRLIGNPGCYPTASLLPLWFLKDVLNEQINLIIIDAKSGLSGAGARTENKTSMSSTASDDFYAYKTARHQHTPEIQSQSRKWLGEKVHVRFIPHLLPIFRGILCTIYIPISGEIKIESIKEKIKDDIKHEPFIRFYGEPDLVQIKKVQETNYLDFAISYDKNSGVLLIVSALDNLVKGAAGQSIQNMNLMFGFEEALSLT